MERQLVVLFGDSLLMDSVEANLADREEMGLVRIRAAVGDIAARLRSLCPDLIIFDFDTAYASFVFPFLRSQPELSLIGLDINCSKAIALTSRQYMTLNADDLACVIQKENWNKKQVGMAA